MNDINNFRNKNKYEINRKKLKSSNRYLKEEVQLPSLRGALAKENKIIPNACIEFINRRIAHKKNHSQSQSRVPKNHKPYSGNPLKVHNNNNGLYNVVHINTPYNFQNFPEREIYTANPNFPSAISKNSYKINNNELKELDNRYLIYSSKNNEHKGYKKIRSQNEITYPKNLFYNYYDIRQKNDKNQIYDYYKKQILCDFFKTENFTSSLNKEKRMKQNNQKETMNSNKIFIYDSYNNINNNDNQFKAYKNNKNNYTLNNTYKHLKSGENIIKELTSKVKNKKNNNPCYISYSYAEDANLEHRKEMEDFHSIVPLLNKNLNLSYFGLFDGHSGKEVGVYLMENFHKILSQEIINNNNINLMNFDNMKNVINNSFAKTNSEINQQNFKNETGSTATILIIYNDNNSPTKRSFICANVGDTKAFMVNKQEIKLMTKDHKCSDKSEVKRIKDSGGIVFRERVFGTLMLTRSFGDKEMKKYGVTYMPDIYYHHIKGDDLYIIIGSDGVWDVVEEGEIFKLCQENISSNELSKKIIKLAKDRETHDNISCIVIKLNEK